MSLTCHFIKFIILTEKDSQPTSNKFQPLVGGNQPSRYRKMISASEKISTALFRYEFTAKLEKYSLIVETRKDKRYNEFMAANKLL